MSEQKARKLTLSVFTKIEICNSDAEGALPLAGHEQLHFRPEFGPSPLTDLVGPVQRNNFPIVVTATGQIWEPALYYIADRVFNHPHIQMSTNHNVADDIALYKQYLDEKCIDHDNFNSSYSYELPTYRYRSWLQQKFENCQLAATTAKRRMQSVISFYRYLIEKQHFVPKNSPWVAKNISLHLKDLKGFSHSRNIETTDLRIQAKKQKDPWCPTIEDGGKLRPLDWPEQVALITALIKVENPEMLLIHLIALFTGARIQSILTLTSAHFVEDRDPRSSDVKIKMGRTTAIDTKGGKEYFLAIPGWLYDKLVIYNQSDRAINRRKKTVTDNNEQHLFLTKFGNPYYASRRTREKFDANRKTKTDSNGQEVRKFKHKLIKAIHATQGNTNFHYRFHDLRATFGMNLTDAQLELVEAKKITLAAAREYVKFRMGHSSYKVTDRYLSFRSNIAFTAAVRDAYGAHLEKLRDIVMSGSE